MLEVPIARHARAAGGGLELAHEHAANRARHAATPHPRELGSEQLLGRPLLRHHHLRRPAGRLAQGIRHDLVDRPLDAREHRQRRMLPPAARVALHPAQLLEHRAVAAYIVGRRLDGQPARRRIEAVAGGRRGAEGEGRRARRREQLVDPTAQPRLDTAEQRPAAALELREEEQALALALPAADGEAHLEGADARPHVRPHLRHRLEEEGRVRRRQHGRRRGRGAVASASSRARPQRRGAVVARRQAGGEGKRGGERLAGHAGRADQGGGGRGAPAHPSGPARRRRRRREPAAHTHDAAISVSGALSTECTGK